MSGAQLGPAAIARVAGFPLSSIEALADAELAEEAAKAHGRPAAMAAFEALHAERMERQRQALWRRTAEDPHFTRALAFANPRLARRVLAQPARAPASKPRRQIESRLYRYLSRACAECQPFGLWAGVALVRFGARTRMSPTSPGCRMAPELGPWYALVARLAREPAYRTRGPWRLNSTLGPSEHAEWTFWTRDASGSSAHRLRGWNAEPFRRLADRGAGSLDELAEALLPSFGAAGARQAVEACIDAGVLVGGLQPPWRFESAGEALREIEEGLLGPHREAWKRARLAALEACARIEAVAQPSCEDVLAAGVALGESLRRLAGELGLACPDLPGALLRCDQRAPFDITLGEDVREALAATLSEYLAFQSKWGFGPAMRQAVMAHYLPQSAPERGLAGLPPPALAAGAPSWQALGARLVAGAEFLARVARWERLLGSGGDAVVARGQAAPLLAPPFGWLRLSPRADAPGRVAAIHGAHDDLWGAYARHAPLWGAADEGLRAWILARLSAIERAAGLRFAELVVPCHGAVNALARPPLGRPALAPWSCAGDVDLRGARIGLRPGIAAPLLECPGESLPLAVLNASSADAQRDDPVAQLLLATSLAATPAAALQASNMLFDAELDSRASPAVKLPGGAVVRAGRRVLAKTERAALAHPKAAWRYAAWAALARRHDWPSLLRLRRSDGMALALHRDSPLAVGSVLAGAAGQRLVVEHQIDEAWLVGEAGERHVAELALPFVRDRHVWSEPVAQSSEASA